MTLEKILGYFGTYTAGVDGAVSSFQFEYLTSLGFAAIVIFLGHAIVKRSALLKKFAIPAPVVSGLLFSIAVAILKASGVMAFSFDVKTIQDLCQNIFFMCVGFGFSWKLIRHAGGKLCIMIAVAACLLITLQDVLGVLVGNLIGMDPYLALQCSSASMSGAIARQGREAAHIKFYTPEVDALEHMVLELYLALVLMTIDITALADVAGQMGIILLLQAALMALFAIFVSYNMFGRNYGAAVMAAGNCGWGCGSGPNAVANEKAVMDQYGWHNVAWVLYPSFAVIIDDIYNPIFLSVFGGLLAH